MGAARVEALSGSQPYLRWSIHTWKASGISRTGYAQSIMCYFGVEWPLVWATRLSRYILDVSGGFRRHVSLVAGVSMGPRVQSSSKPGVGPRARPLQRWCQPPSYCRGLSGSPVRWSHVPKIATVVSYTSQKPQNDMGIPLALA